MGHPLLIAGAAAGAAAFLFGGPGKPPLPANTGGGLQPNPAPSGGLPFGPTSAPAPDSGLPQTTSFTGSDGNVYQSDGFGGALFPTGDDSGSGNVSVPAGTPGPVAAAPTQFANQGVFENVDDTASASAPPGLEDDSDSDGGILSSSDSGGVSLPASVSGGMVGFHVAGPVGAVVGCVVGALMGPMVSGPLPYRKNRRNPTARKSPTHSPPRHPKTGATKVGDSTTMSYAPLPTTSGLTLQQSNALARANKVLTDAQHNSNVAQRRLAIAVQSAGPSSQAAINAKAVAMKMKRFLTMATAYQLKVANRIAQNQGNAVVAGPASGFTPSGLVWSRHVNGWTYPYEGHEYGAPPPAGLPVF